MWASKYIQLKYFDQLAKLETSNFSLIVLLVKNGIYKLYFVKQFGLIFKGCLYWSFMRFRADKTQNIAEDKLKTL